MAHRASIRAGLRRSSRLAVVAGAVLLVGLLVARGAQASSIVYLDANNDIWITSPDGATKRQLTTNGSTMRYTSPSETDAGVIVAGATRANFFYFNQDGSSAGGPWTSLDMNCSWEQSPISNQVNPAGGMNIYWYIDDGSDCMHFYGPTTAFASYNGMTPKGVNPEFAAWYPRWIPGTVYAAAVSEQGDKISVLNTGSGTAWILDPSNGLRFFDISRTGNNVLIADASSSAQNSPSDLILWHNDGTPPATLAGAPVCSLANWGDYGQAPDLSMPRWSPDGTQFTWSDSQGIWVSPAPVNDGSGHCVIHPKLIVAGASYPDWGLPDVKTSAAAPGTNSSGTNPSGTNPSGTSSPGTSSPGTNPQQSACAGIHGTQLERCQAQQQHKTALTACAKKKGKQRTKCVNAANIAYHRKLALIKCESKKGKAKRACINQAKRINHIADIAAAISSI